MTLTQIRALLKQHGHKAIAEIDRAAVKRAAGQIIGVDIMFTDGTVAFLSVEEATA